jgi:hypothetical protein
MYEAVTRKIRKERTPNELKAFKDSSLIVAAGIYFRSGVGQIRFPNCGVY